MTKPIPERPTSLVLLADDDEAARLLIECALTEVNFRVVQTQDGQEVIDVFLRERPDIVLLDVNMPIMDGYEACRTLRTLPGGESVPILMVTGYEDIQAINRAYEAGATDFLAKSSNWAIVAHRVRYMLRASHTLAEAEKSRKSLASAQRIARVGGWEWRVDTDRFLLSRELRDMFGLETGDGEMSREQYLNAVHPDERKCIRTATVAALRNVRPYDVIHRVTLPDGSQRCVHVRAEVEFDPSGRAVRMFGTAQDATDQRTKDQDICRPNHYDSLTGLPNRVMFRDQLSLAIADCARTEQRLAVMLLDLDHFKRINDKYGHGVGDRALAAAAERIAVCVRGSEAAGRGALGCEPHDAAQHLRLLARGGDKFCLFLANVGEPCGAAKVARCILAGLARPMPIGQHEIAMGASIGIAMYPTDGEDAETLLRNAEAAAYQAKEKGRNNYRFFARMMNAEAFHRLSLENALRKAVDNGEFVLHYQPVVGLSDGRIVGAEALVRWQHPELGVALPAEFLALAEETGLIVPIGEWVLEHACRQAAAWRDLTPSPLKISVNVSAVQFAHHAMVQSVNRALQACALDAGQLTLELPESTLMRDAETTLGILRQLAEMGVHLSVDNFGAGYSSFMCLRRFPLHSVKIDRSFVLDLPGNQDAAAIVRAIIGMAHSLKLTVAAEGVETPAQLRFLRELGCEEYQGYVFSPALPAESLTELLRREPNLQGVPPRPVVCEQESGPRNATAGSDADASCPGQAGALVALASGSRNKTAMTAERLSVTLSPKMATFVDAYRNERSLESRSDVIEAALALLRETEREKGKSETPKVEDPTHVGRAAARTSSTNR